MPNSIKKIHGTLFKEEGVVFGLLPQDFLDIVAGRISEFYFNGKMEEDLNTLIKMVNKRGRYYDDKDNMCYALTMREISFLRVNYNNTMEDVII